MNDIDQIRNFRTHLDAPTSGALARARVRAMRSGVEPEPTRSWVWTRRLAWPGAAIAVAATVLGVTVLAVPHGSAPQPGLSASGTVPPPSTPTARDLIERLAMVAEKGPSAPRVDENQLILVRSRYFEVGQWHTESYRIEPYGLIKFDNAEFADRASYQAWVVEQRNRLDRYGASITQPTPQWLATLDPSPGNLRALLIAGFGCPPDGCRAGDAERYLWWAVEGLARQADVMLPPAVRAGLLRVLGEMPGVIAEEVVIEGQRYWAIGLADVRSRDELYVDPSTGSIVGSGAIPLVETADPKACLKAATATANPRQSPRLVYSRPSACAKVPVPPDRQRRVASQFWSTTLVTAG